MNYIQILRFINFIQQNKHVSRLHEDSFNLDFTKYTNFNFKYLNCMKSEDISLYYTQKIVRFEYSN